MRKYAVLAAVAAFLAASLALGQWSEPVWLDTAVTVLVNLPVLIPGQSDTTWSVWSTEYAPMTSELWAGKVVGDSLVSRELVHQDGERLIYAFDGLVEPSGDLRVVYYAGQYETGTTTLGTAPCSAASGARIGGPSRRRYSRLRFSRDWIRFPFTSPSGSIARTAWRLSGNRRWGSWAP